MAAAHPAVRTATTAAFPARRAILSIIFVTCRRLSLTGRSNASANCCRGASPCPGSHLRVTLSIRPSLDAYGNNGESESSLRFNRIQVPADKKPAIAGSFHHSEAQKGIIKGRYADLIITICS